MSTCYPSILDPREYPYFPDNFNVEVPGYVPMSVIHDALQSDYFNQFGGTGGGLFKQAATSYRTGSFAPAAQYFTDSTGLCYLRAADASASQMAKTRDQRNAAKGAPALPESVKNLWRNGWGNFYSGYTAPPGVGVASYEGDFSLSLRQLLMDDITAGDASRVFEPLKSPDTIFAYTPARLSEVQLADTYAMLRHTEENALEVLAQSQDPATVARISTTQTVTDPIGRLVTGAIVQQEISGNQAVETILPSAGGVGPEAVGVGSVVAGTPPMTPPQLSAPGVEQPQSTGGVGWLGIAATVALLFLPKK